MKNSKEQVQYKQKKHMLILRNTNKRSTLNNSADPNLLKSDSCSFCAFYSQILQRVEKNSSSWPILYVFSLVKVCSIRSIHFKMTFHNVPIHRILCTEEAERSRQEARGTLNSSVRGLCVSVFSATTFSIFTCTELNSFNMHVEMSNSYLN